MMNRTFTFSAPVSAAIAPAPCSVAMIPMRGIKYRGIKNLRRATLGRASTYRTLRAGASLRPPVVRHFIFVRAAAHAMPRIEFTSHLRRHLDCPLSQTVEATTVREALEQAFAANDSVRSYIV